jgi:hypothetical protein
MYTWRPGMNEFIPALSSKLGSVLGGFFGGSAILTFIKPTSLGEAFLRGSLSTGSAVVFADALLKYFNLNTDWENSMMSGFIVGFFAYSILGMIANFLIKNQTKDIVEVMKDLKK